MSAATADPGPAAVTRPFLLPDLGEGLTESEIVSWRVAVGDSVRLNQVIGEVETAKAVVELPSPYTGTVTALNYHVNPVSAALLGTVTAIGGGLMRDTVANVRPGLFDRHDLYAIPAMVGAGAVAALWALGLYSTAAGIVVAVVVFAFRILALRLHWRVPLAASSRHRGSGEASARG